MPTEKEGQDNYDIIEFLAAQGWCNGKVSMAGNSYLTMTQYYTGAEKPPHLACLAPWEGMFDLYDDQVCRGGIDITYSSRKMKSHTDTYFVRHPESWLHRWNVPWGYRISKGKQGYRLPGNGL